MSQAVGDILLLRYDVRGTKIFHEGLVVGVGDLAGWIDLVTPDHDEYEFHASRDNTDLAELVLARGFSDRPASIGRTAVHSFAAISGIPSAADVEFWVTSACTRAGRALPVGSDHPRLEASFSGLARQRAADQLL